MRLIIAEATCLNGSKVFSTLSIFAGIVKNRSRVEQLCYPPQATNESVNVEGRIDVGPCGVTLLVQN